MLKDLGLGPALMAAVEDADSLSRPVVICEIENASGILPDQRPPPDVELAAFRIAHEALTNARLHAQAGHVTVSGRVAPDRIDLSIRDDGIGIDPASMQAARRGGHLGLTSMSQRAESIDADLQIQGARPGTLVTLTWSRP